MLLAPGSPARSAACELAAFRLVDVLRVQTRPIPPRKLRFFRANLANFMSEPGDNLRRLTGLYRTMVRIRAFEETALEAHKAGEIPGPLHVSIGQEAVAAGVCVNL